MFAKTALFIKRAPKISPSMLFLKRFKDKINLIKTFLGKEKGLKIGGISCLDPGQLWGLITAIRLAQGQL